MFSKPAFGFTLLVVAAIPLPCFGQAQEVLEEFTGGVLRRPSIATSEINKALGAVISTKDFQEKLPFRDFVKKLPSLTCKKGKEFQIVVDRDAFRIDNDTLLDIEEEEMVLPPVPVKMTGGTALRLALSQVGRGEATYYFRSGQIVITSAKRTLSPHFLESTSVEAKFTNRPLTAALDELAEQSGVSILIDCREWAKAQKPVSARFQEAKLRTAVQLLSDTAGLKAVVVDNVIYVTSPENVAQFKEKTVLRLGHSMTCFGAKDRHLTNAVEDFTSNWVMDGRVKNKTNIRVTAKWLNNIESDTALRLLTDMAGLRHVVIDDVTYITSPANAKKLEEEQARKKPSPD